MLKVTYIQLAIAHIILGFVIYTGIFNSNIFLVLVIGYFLYQIFINGNRNNEVLIAAAYITGFEVFFRMTGGSFSYEFAKFAIISFLVIGIFFKGFTRSSWPYIIYLLLLLPGVFFSAMYLNYDTSIINALSFNLSGPVCLGISALYCYDRKISSQQFKAILVAILLPIISMTIYLYFFTPSIRDTLQGTQANFEASGGFGPNQVSTILGLGMFILFTRLFVVKERLVNFIDLALLVLLSYRGIVTFSRGGIITALICAMAFLFIFWLKSGSKEKTSLITKAIFITIAIIFTWIVTSISTLGLIDKRYSNEDAAGRVKEDITTGRAELLMTEISAFYEKPFTGIGVGKIKEYRLEEFNRLSASHNEISRLLGEHGLFGIAALLILIFTPLIFRITNRTNLYLFAFLIFWFLTINHSSMRIAAPAFIYGLALLKITNDKKKNTVYRK